MKLTSALCWALLLASCSAISTRKSKNKSIEYVRPRNTDVESERVEDSDEVITEPLYDEPKRRTDNITEVKSKKIKAKEDSPLNADVIRPLDLSQEEAPESDFNRESRGDKSRLYYDDASPRYPHHEEEFTGEERGQREHPVKGKQEEGKFYFPNNYMNSKHRGQKGHGKRVPDHEFDVGGQHPVHHEYGVHGSVPLEHEHGHEHGPHHGPEQDSYPHGIEETHGHGLKGHKHIGVYGGWHYGGYHPTIGDKVDVVGKALRVLVPSALLITGVSALFPNRVHVPTTLNKYRQKRSLYRRRFSHRALMVPPPPPEAHLSPEFEDIPTHILRAEHRIMDGDGPEIDVEYGQRYSPSSYSSVNTGGFDPFKVFKGPGPEQNIQKMQATIRLPGFELPEMPDNIRNEYNQNRYQEPQHHPVRQEQDFPSSTYGPENVGVAPTINTIPDIETTQMSFEDLPQKKNKPIRRRKTTRKPPIYITESENTLVQHQPESHKQNYLVKEDTNQVKAEQQFMSSLQNLVTPDVAKAIVENTQAPPPKDVDLSPDGPVMGLLTSYAQHEKDSPACQKRALCEMAVKGKTSKATKFEAFLWSVATLVPDVFSEMYDLQEVFQAIREEGCGRFHCSNPNMDIQLN